MIALGPVLFVLLCTLIGWLIGYPLLGFIIGLVVVLVAGIPARPWR